MYKVLVVAGLIGVMSFSVFAQEGVMGDVMSGKLVNPSVGVWAWYDVKDAASGQHLFLRQAVVGEERVDGKNGYWIETELVPQVGFPLVYKMLVTGPASDPRNIHKVFVREANGQAQEMPIDASGAPEKKAAEAEKKGLGSEKIDTPQGAVETEHLVIEQDGKTTNLWTSEKVPPMGIVKLVSADGELVLQRFGKGGPDGQSAIDKRFDLPPAKGETKVTVKVDGETREVPQDQKGPAAETVASPVKEAGKAQSEAPSTGSKKNGSAKKKNYSTKKDGQ